MTTILPPQELAVIRSVAKSAAVLFVWMSIERLYPGRPVSENQFADMLGVDVRTVKNQLRGLSSAGLALGQGGWWMLTPNGKYTLFGAAQNVQMLEVGNTDGLSGQTSGREREDLGGLGETPRTFCVNSTQNVPLEEEDYIESDFNKSSSSSENAKFAKTEQILRYTYLLFESGSVNINDVTRTADPMTALAWIGKAYADRARLNLPQGLVYQRLMRGDLPPVYLRKDPTKGLPSKYLEAIGLLPAIPDDAEPEQDFEEVSEPEEIVEPYENNPAQNVWNAVAEQLRTEMPRASFETWVRDAEAVSLAEGVLVVSVQNESARDWLEGRLESTVNRMLIGICVEAVRVRFVSAGGV